MPRYACETRVVSGLGSIQTLPEEIAFYKLSKLCLVVDEGIAKAGLLEQWLPKSVASIDPRITCPVNPNLDAVRAGVQQAKDANVDGVIIVGGGSAICLGKAVAICMANPGDILDYEGNEKLKKVNVLQTSSIYPLILSVANYNNRRSNNCRFWQRGISCPCSGQYYYFTNSSAHLTTFCSMNMAVGRKSSFEH